jgi:hypothetical protein
MHAVTSGSIICILLCVNFMAAALTQETCTQSAV